MFNNLSGNRKIVVEVVVVGLATEDSRDTKKKKEDAQKEDTLQPITKVNTKLDKELQDWEVDSTMSGG